MVESLMPEAFVSLATNDFYATGALTLGKSLRDTQTTRKLALVITSGVSEQMRHTLSQVWDELILVKEIDSGDAESLAVLCRPELGVTFTKIAVWTLTQYSKCVFLDADTLVLCNVDELFLREELSAAPDVGWPDCFNSGVFVFCPSQETFRSLLALAQQLGSFDGGDQGLLNLHWSNWSADDIKYHLPFIYNMTANTNYGYAPALLRFKDSINIVHFIGEVKPWQHTYLRDLDTVVLMPGTYSSQNSNQDFILKWWRVYSSLNLEVSTHTSIMEARHRQSQAEEAKFSHRREFELGNIDYHGRDSFENIMALIKIQVGDLCSLKSRVCGSPKGSNVGSLRNKTEESLSKAVKFVEPEDELGLAYSERKMQNFQGKMRQRFQKEKTEQELQEDKVKYAEQVDSTESVNVASQENKPSKNPAPKEASLTSTTWLIIIFTLLLFLFILYLTNVLKLVS